MKISETMAPSAPPATVDEMVNNPSDEGSEKKQPSSLTLKETCAVLLTTCALSGSYVVAFSAVIGYGGDTFRALRRDQGENVMFNVAFVIAIALYVTDASHWTHPRWRLLRDFGAGASATLATLALGLSAFRYPQAPPTIYLLLSPLFYIRLRSAFFAERSMASYLSTLAQSLYACSGVILMLFFAEASRTRAWWSSSLDVEYRAAIGCDTDLKTECIATYVMWFSPCLAALASFIFATFCSLLASSVRSNDKKSILHFTYKAFGCAVMFVFLGIWIAVSIAGGAKPLSSILVTFSMASLLVLCGSLVATLGLDAVTESVTSVPLFASIVNAITEKYADIFKAILVSTPLTFVFCFYVALSVVNQRLRALLGTAKSESSSSRWVTAKVARQIDELRKWNWAKIMVNMHYWILVVLAFQVVAGSFTVVFLSFLRVKLNSVPLGLVYVTFTVVGLGMFLIPIIPGLPVYLTGGIILTDERMVQAYGGGGKGYAMACVVAISVCFAIKLLAVVMQQKGIGERLGDRVWIRSMVNVNSVTMRSIRFLLTKPGLKPPKIAILVGGPDWPTSVITGILKLNVYEMLIGTLPVLLLIAPTTLAGAFMLKASRATAVGAANALCRETSAISIVDEDASPWNSIADIGLLLTGLSQGLALVAAAYFIEKTAAENRDELDELSYDEEVLQLDRDDAHRQDLMRAIMQWDELSGLSRRVLVLSTMSIVLAFWGIMFGPSVLGEESIVRDYLLTDCVSTRLDGKPWRIMTALGWALLGMACASLFVVRRLTANAKVDVDAIIDDEKDFVASLDGKAKRSWPNCPNPEEPIDEERFRRRMESILETMSFDQIDEVRLTMSERTLMPFTDETKVFIKHAIDRALLKRSADE